MKTARWATLGKIYLAMGLLLAFNLLPPLWTLVTSFKVGREVFQYPPTLLPASPSFENYIAVLYDFGLGRASLNSVLIAASSTILLVIIGSLAAYAHSRFRFLGNWTLFVIALVLRMVPPISLLVPLYNLGSQIGLRGTMSWLVLLYLAFNLPTAIWILKVFMDQIPTEITDAARIDGCGSMAMFFRIIWPLSMPAVAVVAILLFPAVWNEFLISRTFTTAVTRTLPVALEPVILTGGVDYWGAHWGTASAGAMLVTLPLIPIAIFFQRYLISGLMAGSVKG